MEQSLSKNNQKAGPTVQTTLLKLISEKLDSFYPELSPTQSISVNPKSISGIGKFSRTTNVLLFQISFIDKNSIKHEKELIAKCKTKIGSGEFDRMHDIWKNNHNLVPRPLYKRENFFITEFTGPEKLINSFLPHMLVFSWHFHIKTLLNKIHLVSDWLCEYQKLQTHSEFEPTQPYIDQAIKQMDASSRYLPAQKESIRKKILELAEGITELPVVENHGDFYFRNILYNHNQLKVIDWESRPRRGNCLLDYNCFLLNILSIARYPIFSNICCMQLYTGFKEAYQSQVPFPVSPEMFKLTHILFMIQYLDDYDTKIKKWTPKKTLLNDRYMKTIQKLLIQQSRNNSPR